MITKLTDSQLDKLKDYREKWINIGLSTTPVTLERAIEIIHPLQTELLGRKATPVVLMDNPLHAWLAVCFLAKLKDQVWEQVKAQVGYQIGGEIGTQVWGKVRDQVRGQIEYKVGLQVVEQVWSQVKEQVVYQIMDKVRDYIEEQVWFQVEDRVRDQVWSHVEGRVVYQIMDQIRSQVREQVMNQVGGQIEGQVWTQVGVQVKSQVGYHVMSHVRDQVMAQIENQVNNQVRSQVQDQIGGQALVKARSQLWDHISPPDGYQAKDFIWPWIVGQWESGMFGFYDFFITEANVNMPDELLRKFEIWKATAELGIIYPLEHVAVVCQKPKAIHKNEHGLHREGGMALEYEGWGFYALNGVRVPEYLAMTPSEHLDIQFFHNEENADVRTEFVRKYGVERMLSLGKKIDSYENYNEDWWTKSEYELWDMATLFPNLDYQPYLKMLNQTTKIWHVEAVSPNCRTLRDAIKERFGGRDFTIKAIA